MERGCRKSDNTISTFGSIEKCLWISRNRSWSCKNCASDLESFNMTFLMPSLNEAYRMSWSHISLHLRTIDGLSISIHQHSYVCAHTRLRHRIKWMYWEKLKRKKDRIVGDCEESSIHVLVWNDIWTASNLPFISDDVHFLRRSSLFFIALSSVYLSHEPLYSYLSMSQPRTHLIAILFTLALFSHRLIRMQFCVKYFQFFICQHSLYLWIRVCVHGICVSAEMPRDGNCSIAWLEHGTAWGTQNDVQNTGVNYNSTMTGERKKADARRAHKWKQDEKRHKKEVTKKSFIQKWHKLTYCRYG